MNNLAVRGNSVIKLKSEYLAGFLLFVLSAPYFFWPILNNAYGVFIIGGVLAFLFYSNRMVNNKKNSLLFILFVVIAILYWWTSGNNINFFLLLSPVLLMPFCNDDYSYKTYQCFFTIFSVIIFLATIEYVLASIGVLAPRSTIVPLNSLKSATYHVYFTLVSTVIPPIRFFGPYDEPGVVGTISAILLSVEKFNFKDKRVLIVFIAGLLSLSLFFYITVIICWVLIRMGNKRSVTSIVIIIAVLFAMVIIVPKVPVLNEYIAGRLVFDKESGFSGDNRIDMEIVNGYLGSMHGNSLWFGIQDKEYYLQLVEGSSSIYTTIIVYGLLFFLAYLLFFVIYALNYKKNTI